MKIPPNHPTNHAYCDYSNRREFKEQLSDLELANKIPEEFTALLELLRAIFEAGFAAGVNYAMGNPDPADWEIQDHWHAPDHDTDLPGAYFAGQAGKIEKQVLIRNLLDGGFPRQKFASDMQELKLAVFTGNQWNPDWQWDAPALHDHPVEILRRIYRLREKAKQA